MLGLVLAFSTTATGEPSEERRPSAANSTDITIAPPQFEDFTFDTAFDGRGYLRALESGGAHTVPSVPTTAPNETVRIDTIRAFEVIQWGTPSLAKPWRGANLGLYGSLFGEIGSGSATDALLTVPAGYRFGTSFGLALGFPAGAQFRVGFRLDGLFAIGQALGTQDLAYDLVRYGAGATLASNPVWSLIIPELFGSGGGSAEVQWHPPGMWKLRIQGSARLEYRALERRIFNVSSYRRDNYVFTNWHPVFGVAPSTQPFGIPVAVQALFGLTQLAFSNAALKPGMTYPLSWLVGAGIYYVNDHLQTGAAYAHEFGPKQPFSGGRESGAIYADMAQVVISYTW